MKYFSHSSNPNKTSHIYPELCQLSCKWIFHVNKSQQKELLYKIVTLLTLLGKKGKVLTILLFDHFLFPKVSSLTHKHTCTEVLDSFQPFFLPRVLPISGQPHSSERAIKLFGLAWRSWDQFLPPKWKMGQLLTNVWQSTLVKLVSSILMQHMANILQSPYQCSVKH